VRVACVVPWLLGAAALAWACDGDRRGSPADASVDALARALPSVEAPATGTTAPGCARAAGSIEGLESDPACVLGRVDGDVTRDLERRLAMTATVDPDVVVAAGAAVLRVAFTNVSSEELFLVLEAHARAPGPRPDWSRLAGVPDVKGERHDLPRLQFGVTTTDVRERPVDDVPLVRTASAPQTGPRLLGVRLKPGGILTHTIAWWALRIPAPAPIFKDDAGHRYVPKTTAIPLPPAEYVVAIEVPLYALPPQARTVRAHVRVERAIEKDR
jgi:hypothetical protein